MVKSKPIMYLAAVGFMLLAGASQAQAWGVCGRGQWVSMPPWSGGVNWGATSTCNCSSGLTGNAQVRDDWKGLVWATGQNNGGVGIEFEATVDGNRTFVPATYVGCPAGGCLLIPFTIGSGFYLGTSWGLLTPGWSQQDDGYSYSRRYRSVCINNYSDFTRTMIPMPREPWMYD